MIPGANYDHTRQTTSHRAEAQGSGQTNNWKTFNI